MLINQGISDVGDYNYSTGLRGPINNEIIEHDH